LAHARTYHVVSSVNTSCALSHAKGHINSNIRSFTILDRRTRFPYRLLGATIVTKLGRVYLQTSSALSSRTVNSFANSRCRNRTTTGTMGSLGTYFLDVVYSFTNCMVCFPSSPQLKINSRSFKILRLLGEVCSLVPMRHSMTDCDRRVASHMSIWYKTIQISNSSPSRRYDVRSAKKV
jgi:hypothetical protein